MCVYIYIYTHIHVYIYIYREREIYIYTHIRNSLYYPPPRPLAPPEAFVVAFVIFVVNPVLFPEAAQLYLIAINNSY